MSRTLHGKTESGPYRTGCVVPTPEKAPSPPPPKPSPFRHVQRFGAALRRFFISEHFVGPAVLFAIVFVALPLFLGLVLFAVKVWSAVYRWAGIWAGI